MCIEKVTSSLGKGSPKPKPRPRPAPRPRTKPDQSLTPEVRKRPSVPNVGVDEVQSLQRSKENVRPPPAVNHPTHPTYVEEDLYDEPEMTLRSGWVYCLVGFLYAVHRLVLKFSICYKIILN